MGLKKKESNGIPFLSVIQGTLMMKVDEGTPDAVEREYEDKDGNKKTKHELHYSSIDGRIVGIEFAKSDFGEQCIVTMQDVDEKYNVALSLDNRFFTDFAKKLPNVDLSKDVTLSPYDFEDKEGKQVKGMTIEQDGEKVYSYYYDADKKKTINGLPEVSAKDRKEYDSDDWKMFFIKERKFLKKAVEGIKLPDAPKSTGGSKATAPEPAVDLPEDDLPF